MSNVVDLASRARRSRRGPRRDDVGVYRVRVDLVDAAEPLWRHMELASDLFLEELHAVLQAAFGWTDSHLHRFACGENYYDQRAEYYLMPFQIDEGEPGVPEEQVRLDEVLTRAGDALFYCYDFGDDWQHIIQLEDVQPGTPHGSRALCVDGEGPALAEDCGGVHGYDLLVAATDPGHVRHDQARAEYTQVFGEEADPAAFTIPFDPEAINSALDELGLDARPVSQLPEELADLVHAIRLAPARHRLRRLLAAARMEQLVSVDEATAARIVRPYQWLLNRVGADGIRLTAAGYLPPAHVEAAVHELGLAEEWIGKGNRENQTYPVLELRESAQRAGLLRKHKGRLMVTVRGRALSGDAAALWSHLAERMPPALRDVCERQAGLLLLIVIAAGVSDDVDAMVAEFLDAIGWTTATGAPLSTTNAAYAAAETTAVLQLLGGFEPHSTQQWRRRPSADGVTFARAVLQLM